MYYIPIKQLQARLTVHNAIGNEDNASRWVGRGGMVMLRQYLHGSNVENVSPRVEVEGSIMEVATWELAGVIWNEP